MPQNQYGLDTDYFANKLEIILRDIQNYTPDELARELARMAVTADKTVLSENEFIAGITWKPLPPEDVERCIQSRRLAVDADKPEPVLLHPLTAEALGLHMSFPPPADSKKEIPEASEHLFICADCKIRFKSEDETGTTAVCPECGSHNGNFITPIMRCGSIGTAMWLDNFVGIIRDHESITGYQSKGHA